MHRPSRPRATEAPPRRVYGGGHHPRLLLPPSWLAPAPAAPALSVPDQLLLPVSVFWGPTESVVFRFRVSLFPKHMHPASILITTGHPGPGIRTRTYGSRLVGMCGRFALPSQRGWLPPEKPPGPAAGLRRHAVNLFAGSRVRSISSVEPRVGVTNQAAGAAMKTTENPKGLAMPCAGGGRSSKSLTRLPWVLLQGLQQTPRTHNR